MPSQQPVEIVLVLDTSSSMEELTRDGRSKLDAAVGAARALVAVVQLELGSRVAIVSFDAVARTVLEPSGDREDIERALGGLVTGRETCIPCAIEEAAAVLASSAPAPDVARAVILLTDGRSNPRPVAEAVVAATNIKAEGVTIYTIGLGDDLERDALRAIATTAEDFYEAPDGEDLEAIYERIAVEIPCPAGRYWGRR